MKIPLLAGWKFHAWWLGSLAWAAYYAFGVLPAGALAADAATQGATAWFNGLFPVFLLYLLLSIGRRR